jgi:magnesium transporter
MDKQKMTLADDNTQSVGFLFRLRLPSLVIGLLLGMVLSFVTSRFEEVLSKNVSVAFFIPFVVYLADAVGTQTQNIYSRDLKEGKASFKKYFIKESLLGIFFGLIFSAISAPIILILFKSSKLALAVALALFGAIASAPIIALGVTEILQLEHKDPAVGAGPIATVIQDTVSVMIYGLIASAILL